MMDFNDGNQYHFITDPDSYERQRLMLEFRVWSGSSGSMQEDTLWRKHRDMMQPRLDGMLWYQKPLNTMSAEDQANLFCDSLGKLAPNEMVMLDCEKNGNQPTSDLGDYADFMRRWCAVVETRLNTWAWIYVPLNISGQLHRGVTGNRIVKAPHYSAVPNWPHDVHQYTDKGDFPGANGPGDCNRTNLSVPEMLDRCRRGGPIVINNPPPPQGGNMRVQLSPNNDGNGSLQNPIWLVVHTAQGATTDESLADYIGRRSSEVSYHYLFDDDSVTRCLNEDQQAWAALGANRYGIHFCTTGFVAWSREEWLKHPDMLNMLGDVMRDVGGRYGIDGEHLNDDQIRQHIKGSIGHGDYARATRDGDHTDPLPNFPWDYLAARMAGQPVGPPPVPVLPPMQGAILDHYRNVPGLADLLGAPTPDNEFPTPDGEGRYTHCERGSIYWHPSTGAFSVMGGIRDEWARNHWELGQLGYPLSDEFQSDYERQSNFQHGWIGWNPDQGAHIHF